MIWFQHMTYDSPGKTYKYTKPRTTFITLQKPIDTVADWACYRFAY